MLPQIKCIVNKGDDVIDFYVNGTHITTWKREANHPNALAEFKRIYLAGFDRGRNFEKGMRRR